jgi:tripartite-type tricarboxylate transporter receptor subunit TctC
MVNLPGAGGLIAARAAAAAAPDGHTLFMAIASVLTVLPASQPNLPFDLNAFVPVGFVGEVPMAIWASPKITASNLPDLIAYSKRQLGGINVATLNRGSVPHLTVELLRSRSGVALTPVFYPGGSPQAMSDLITGRVPLGVEGLAGSMSGGQLRALAIASPARVASHPDVPTVAETLPGFATSGWFVLVAPPGTPMPIVNKVSDDLHAVLASADVKQRFQALNISTRSMSPQQLSEFIRDERQLRGPVIERAGLAPK